VGLRETLNENPKIVTGATAGLIVIVLGWIIISSFGGNSPGSGGTAGAAKAYFSDDDGKSYFADDAKKIPPFDHNGKQAVKANVYRCGGKEFVNHLERYTPEAKKKAEAAVADARAMKDPTIMSSIQQEGLEVKRPGEAKWVKLADAKSQTVVQPQGPGGGNPETLEVVYP
jgi:hypothetical protein